jgi:hypothetical protein
MIALSRIATSLGQERRRSAGNGPRTGAALRVEGGSFVPRERLREEVEREDL